MVDVALRPALRVPRRFSLMMPLSPVVSLLPVPLPALLRLSGSDKQSPGRHQYGAAYAALFRRLKYARIKLLEIGIGGHEGASGGESLAAWRSYFPFAKVVGADVLDKRVLARRNLQIHVVDQGSAESLDQLAALEGPFDVIIDDGSHFNAHQILTFERLFPHLAAGGIYVVEDVQTSYWTPFGGQPVESPAFAETCVGYFVALAKYVNHAEFESPDGVDPTRLAWAQQIRAISFEHNLIVVHKQPAR